MTHFTHRTRPRLSFLVHLQPVPQPHLAAWLARSLGLAARLVGSGATPLRRQWLSGAYPDVRGQKSNSSRSLET